MDWLEFATAMGALVGGSALRFFVPYVLSALQVVSEKGWSAWPRFEAKYAATFATSIVLYSVALLTIPGAAETLAALPPIPAISLGYSGGELVREGVKTVSAKLR